MARKSGSGDSIIFNLRYADDSVVLASSRPELQNVMNRLTTVSERCRLKLNKTKTKIMIVDRAQNNEPEVRNVADYEIVNYFNYHGLLTTNQGGYEEEIRKRLAMVRTATVKLRKI